MLHFHGMPLTPRSQLLRLKGKNFCVPFSDPRDTETCLTIGQMVMFDNGAFTAHTKKVKFDRKELFRWLERYLRHPHWAVALDIIDGTVDDQREALKEWPFPRELSAPVWHIHLPMDYLLELIDNYPRVCFGSSGQFWDVRKPEWRARIDEVWDFILQKRQVVPNIHMLRAMSAASKGDWPFASADSTNVSRNYKSYGWDCVEKATEIDASNPPILCHHTRREAALSRLPPPLVLPTPAPALVACPGASV